MIEERFCSSCKEQIDIQKDYLYVLVMHENGKTANPERYHTECVKIEKI